MISKSYEYRVFPLLRLSFVYNLSASASSEFVTRNLKVLFCQAIVRGRVCVCRSSTLDRESTCGLQSVHEVLEAGVVTQRPHLSKLFDEDTFSLFLPPCSLLVSLSLFHYNSLSSLSSFTRSLSSISTCGVVNEEEHERSFISVTTNINLLFELYEHT